ncbi:MAG: ParB/RepB/Spo0J family partition protein [Deltaproteobacteria bacterium]|jgi:ParB family chromosome partitioning protein|nr:ParB/RepB/Spo0J family partition protein [Deltaproteobacteria bacterium]
MGTKKRKALGRGLSSLLPEKKSSTKIRSEKIKIKPEKIDKSRDEVLDDYREISINSLEPSSKQPRRAMDNKHLEELTDSIREKGVLSPIIVREKSSRSSKYIIIAGERRWRASRRAGLTKIPVIVKTTDELESFELALIENIQREDLSALDEAVSYEHLMVTTGCHQEELARRVGKSRSSVANSLRLLRLPREVKTMLNTGKLTVGHARALLSFKSEDDMVKVAARVIKEGLSVRDVEKIVRKGAPTSKKSRKKKKLSPQLKQIEDHLRTSLGTKVKIKTKSKEKGSVSIEYYSLEQLDDIIKYLS